MVSLKTGQRCLRVLMKRPNRRTFLKCSAAIAATQVTGRAFKNSVLAGLRFSAEGAELPYFEGVQKPEVIAHRGGDGHWPGETMYAMRRATEIGADVLEMDV